MFRPSRPTFPDDATDYESEKVSLHFEHLRRLQVEGDLMLAGRTKSPEPFGIAIIRMPDLNSAKRFLAEDPAVAAGVFKGEVFPFGIALLHEFLVAEREMDAREERRKAMGF